MALFTGMVIGFFVAAPLGPIDMLCIQTSLKKGRNAGLITGLGAAFADVIWATLAALGIVAFKDCLTHYQVPFGVIGGVFLLALGYRTFVSKQKQEAAGKGHASGFLSTFFLTLLSPTTLLSFSGAFAIMGIDMEGAGNRALFLLVSGVFLGSTIWWIILSSAVSSFKGVLELKHLEWINRFSGVFLLGFGIFVLVQTYFLSLA